MICSIASRLCKWFVRSDLDYGDMVYDQPNNQSFSDKIEMVQYNAALTVTNAIQKKLLEGNSMKN